VTTGDTIDAILGPRAAAAVAPLRTVKPELAAQMQDYYRAVFDPSAESGAQLSPEVRWLIAIRTASHTGSASVVDWYAARATEAGIEPGMISDAQDVENAWKSDPRTNAIMRHVDLIVTRPVESTRTDIEALSSAGVSPPAIVALSQVVAYVSYQLRLIAVFRALGELS
jgi:uncharacterized protein YciW